MSAAKQIGKAGEDESFCFRSYNDWAELIARFAPPDNKRLHAENRELREGIECLLIGACAVGVPHPEERKVLQEAVAIARAALTRHAPNGAGSEPAEEKDL